jgi:hypothetical protein
VAWQPSPAAAPTTLALVVVLLATLAPDMTLPPTTLAPAIA